MNMIEALRHGEQILEQSNIVDARIDAWLLLEWVTGISRAEYFMNPKKELNEQEMLKFEASIAKRSERIPLQHITGEQEFMGLSFFVNEHVLIPRQDTECLVELALKYLKPQMKVLDMCTGSGCIIISMEKFGQKSCGDSNRYYGSDVSEEALEVAKQNAKYLESKVEFIQGDLFENVQESFDMIISNPPYIRTAVIEELEQEVKGHDPMLALDGKEDGLFFYRRIIDEARTYINDGGYLFFEIGYDQKAEVTDLMKEAGYKEITAMKDLAGLDRVVFGRYYIG